MITPDIILNTLFGGGMLFMWWNIRKYITKIDDLENRVIKIETVLSMLGDIKSDINTIKTDVEVIKSKYP